MQSIAEFTPEQAKGLRYLFCDIDDTITTDGKLTAAAYQALWDCTDAGLAVIPVTGRPAGWCDLMVRQWPVTAVIGENGAFVNYFKQNQLHTFTHPSVDEAAQQKLLAVQEAVLAAIPGTRVSKDQFCRRYDLAIDFNEDPPFLGFQVAEEIKELCCSMGAEAKVSSIHVNTWFGTYDKVSMTQLFAAEILAETALQQTSFFFGDSPNDEPMFGFFPYSCAVANIKPFVSQLTHMPRFIAEEESGAGFCATIQHILALRKA